ncbi:MAG: ester cyclase [Bacteroidota bacterium]|nr:ester cyclase [Bacteroidota bacterium]
MKKKQSLTALTAVVFLLTFIFVSCNNDKNGSSTTSSNSDSTKMSNDKESKEERNKKTVMASVDEINAHNTDAALKDATADIVDYGDGSGNPVKGVDSVKAFVRELFTAFPDYKGENLMYFAEGDYVAVVGDWSGTFKKDAMGMKATGKSFKVRDTDIFKFNDEGKMIEHKGVQAMATIMNQVGAKMPQ